MPDQTLADKLAAIAADLSGRPNAPTVKTETFPVPSVGQTEMFALASEGHRGAADELERANHEGR